MLNRYPFDGVFLDKIRFPSPANGLNEVLSCFCDHCRRAAAADGLHLASVARSLQEPFVASEPPPATRGKVEKSWLGSRRRMASQDDDDYEVPDSLSQA
jgi:hypothetical protein